MIKPQIKPQTGPQTKPHAIVVGFGPGLGTGIARAFAAAGFGLSLVSRKQTREENSLPAEIAADFYPADAGDPAALSAALQAAVRDSGAPDVLIYNVVAPAMGKPTSIDPASLTTDFSKNVTGALVSAQTVLPDMLRRGAGTLLFTGGGWALYPSVDFASISIGKVALRALTFLLADELKDTPVRVGTLTVMGTVQANTAFDPDAIGRAFLHMYRQPKESFSTEVQFRGV